MEKESGHSGPRVNGASGDAGPGPDLDPSPETNHSPEGDAGDGEPGSSRCLSTSSFLEKLLGVDLIAKRLLSYLNLEDLKALSGVSWGTLCAVRKLGNFSNLARLHLTKEVLKNGLLKLGDGEGDTFNWRNVSLDIGPWIPIGFLDSDPLREALEVAESLNIHYGSQICTGDLQYAFLRLEGILKKTRNLKVLGLEVVILNQTQAPNPGFFTNPDIRRLLGGLHGLVILGYRRPLALVVNGDYYSMKLEDGSEPGNIPLHRNMLQLSQTLRLLKRFSFLPYFGSGEKELKLGKFIKAIMVANRGSVEVLELRVNFLDEVGDGDIQCPNLRSLKLKADGRFTFLLEQFLMAQSPLEELDIFLDEKCDFHFLQGLSEAGKLGKLKRLQLEAHRYMFLNRINGEDFNLDVLAMDWQFLIGITQLKDFSFTGTCTEFPAWHGDGEKILGCLPPTTEKIALKGLSRFWRDETRNIGLLLSRFQNLTKLDLLGSYDTVTDEGMQSLIVNCPKLTSLTISWCRTLTDFGLTGVRVRNRVEERTGISLDQLKGLVHLRIRDCFEVSREGLLSVLKFEQLRSFEYRDHFRDPRWCQEFCQWLPCCLSPTDFLTDSDFLFRIGSQNPSLEKLSMHPFQFEPGQRDQVYALKCQLRHTNPRLKVLDLSSRRMSEFM